MKGQNEALTPVIITGIMIAVVASAYLWGMPLIQKNKDSIYLKQSESFMYELGDKIKFVANNGGKETITFNIPGTLRFFPDQNYIGINITTDGTIYSIGSALFVGPLDPTAGTWGVDEPFIIKETTTRVGKKYATAYAFQTIPLCNENRCYEINLDGKEFATGNGHEIYIVNEGTSTQVIDGKTYTYTKIKISFS